MFCSRDEKAPRRKKRSSIRCQTQPAPIESARFLLYLSHRIICIFFQLDLKCFILTNADQPNIWPSWQNLATVKWNISSAHAKPKSIYCQCNKQPKSIDLKPFIAWNSLARRYSARRAENDLQLVILLFSPAVSDWNYWTTNLINLVRHPRKIIMR